MRVQLQYLHYFNICIYVDVCICVIYSYVEVGPIVEFTGLQNFHSLFLLSFVYLVLLTLQHLTVHRCFAPTTKHNQCKWHYLNKYSL